MNSWTDGLLIIGGSTIIAIVGMWLVRKRISRESLEACHEVGGIMLAIVGTLYAIVVGLIVVDSQSKVDAAKQMSITESNMLSNIFHLTKTFKNPARHKIREAIHEYAVAVTKQDWERIEENREKEGTIPPYRKIWKEVTDYNPTNNNEQQCYATVLNNLEDLSAARKYRMVASKNGLSSILWSVLVAGGIGIVLFTYFFFVENMVAQTIMTGFVTVFLAMNVYLIHVCQNPYRPELGAKDAGFGFSFTPDWFIDNLPAGEQKDAAGTGTNAAGTGANAAGTGANAAGSAGAPAAAPPQNKKSN